MIYEYGPWASIPNAGWTSELVERWLDQQDADRELAREQFEHKKEISQLNQERWEYQRDNPQPDSATMNARAKIMFEERKANERNE